MASVYFLDDKYQKHGPVELEELPGLGLKPDTPVWLPGLKEWTPAKNVPAVAALLPQPAPVAPQPAPAAPQPVQPTPVTFSTPAASVETAYAPRENEGNTPGVVGLVCALLCLVAWVPFFGFAVTWIVALIFSLVGLGKERKGMAIGGLIICVLLLIFGIFAVFIADRFISGLMRSADIF